MDEDAPLQLGELLARLEPELVDERRARVAVRRERLGLAARAVQRQHQLPGEPLAQRVVADGRRELADELGVPAVGELALEAALERGQAQLLEPRDLALGEVLEREIGERRAAPERQRLRVARPARTARGSGAGRARRARHAARSRAAASPAVRRRAAAAACET